MSGIQRRTSCFSFPFSQDKQDSTQPEGVSAGSGEGAQLSCEGGFAAWRAPPACLVLAAALVASDRPGWVTFQGVTTDLGEGDWAPTVSVLNLTLGP